MQTHIDNALARQQDREDAMRERGIHRARKAHQKAMEGGRAAETPAGVQLAKRAIAPLADALRAFVADAYKGTAGRKAAAAKLLKDVDPELAAYITVRVVLGKASLRHTLRSAASAVAEQLEVELLAERMEGENSALYRAVIRNARARGLAADRQAHAIREANRHFKVVERPWTAGERLHVGVKLVELAIETLGIVNSHLQREGRTVTTHRLELTPATAEWLKKYNAAAALTRPVLLPTVVPPVPWEGIRGGAYYTDVLRGGAALVTRPFKGQLEALEAAVERGQMAPVLGAVNALQATPWRVNKRVLAVMKEAWENNAQGLPMPPREDAPPPVAPPEVVNAERGSEVRRAWRRDVMRPYYEARAAAMSQRFEFQRALDIATDCAEGAIYFPHRLDFRGRAYAAATTLNPQGSDECRALLEFAEGKPLGERGVWWSKAPTR